MEKPQDDTQSNQSALDQSARSAVSHMVGPIFMNADLSDFPALLGKDVLSALDAGRGLFITGLPGRGKTHLAAALLRVVINGIYNKSGCWKSVFFRHEADMLLEIRQAFSPGSMTSEGQMVEQFSYPDVLIVDDLGVTRASEWVMQTIDVIVDRRYRAKKVTIVTSNLSLSEIGKRLGGRVSSRLAGMCEIIVLQGLDRRMMMN